MNVILAMNGSAKKLLNLKKEITDQLKPVYAWTVKKKGSASVVEK